MAIHCINCNAEIPASNVNLDNLMAKCGSCNSVFSISGMVLDLPTKKREVLEIGVPEGMTIENTGFNLVIRWRWFNIMALFLVPFSCAWDGFLIFFLAVGGSKLLFPMLIFLIPFVLVGLGVTYLMFSMLLNTSTLKVDSAEISLQHGPLPFPGKRTSIAEVRQLYCKEVFTRSRSSTSTSYQVHVLTADNRDVTLVPGLTPSQRALFIEQEVEKFLRIVDTPVRGEYK